MLISPAYAQTVLGGDNPLTSFLVPMVLVFVIFYFLMLRPQQKRAKQHQEMIKNVRRGDTVITNGGLVGKVIGVPQEGVERAHRPTKRRGQKQERIEKVPRVSPRRCRTEPIARPKRPGCAHRGSSMRDRAVALGSGIGSVSPASCLPPFAPARLALPSPRPAIEAIRWARAARPTSRSLVHRER